MKRLIVALWALAVIAGVSACGSASVPLPTATTVPAPHGTSARAPQPSTVQASVSFRDFHSVRCTLLGPGENGDPRLVFEVDLQVNSAITVSVHSLTIQWHRKYLTGPVIATETVPVGPGKPPVTASIAWAFAWPSTSGLTISQNGAAGPDPVACTVRAISGTATTSGSGS